MKQPPLPARIPETMGPDEIGPYLRTLREQFKLTQQDVSERLHIRVRYVAAIEEAKYENMPGKVYARGYVHTYAEFLGLDPEQVVVQCFPPVTATVAAAAPDTASATKPALVPPVVAKNFVSSTPAAKAGSGGMVWFGAAALGAVVLASVFFSGGSSSTAVQDESSVAPVPEALLASVRNEVLPVMNNYECLTNSAILPCYFAQLTVQQLGQLERDAVRPFADEVAELLAHPPEPETKAPVADAAPAETESNESQ